MVVVSKYDLFAANCIENRRTAVPSPHNTQLHTISKLNVESVAKLVVSKG